MNVRRMIHDSKMRRNISFLLFTLLLLGSGQIQLTNADDGMEKLFDVGSTFVPMAEPLIKIAKSIWNSVELFKEKFDDTLKDLSNRELLEKFNEGLDEVKDKVTEVGDKVERAANDITQETVKDNKILDVHKMLMEVFSQFSTFTTYVRNGVVHNSTMTDFCQDIISHRAGSLTRLLNAAHDLVTEKETNTELMKLITDPDQSVAFMCKRKQSPMHVIHTLYNEITSAELKAMILVRYAYWYLYKDRYHEYKGSIEAFDTQVKTRLDKTILTIKHYMKNAGLQFWTCDSGNSYEKLSPIFYMHVMPEQDGGEMVDGSIKSYDISQNCAYFTKKAFYDVCDSVICNFIEDRDRPVHCPGYVHDCYSHEKSSYHVEVCLADRNSGRKYKKVKIGEGDDALVLGEKIECANYLYRGKSWDRLFYAREICICTCDDHSNNNADRYFSLKDVVSDIQQNKVITGVRIILKSRVFQFKIQQAIMTEFGNINQMSVRWKNESVYPTMDELKSNSFHKITYDTRTINLDHLVSPPNTVLTGLRFGKNKNGALQLEIRYTPINFAKGKLDPNPENSKWKSADLGGDRPEIKFKTELPKGNWFKPDAHDRAYLKFAISSLEEDIGQTVVPFIDTARVEGIPATMLSGAALVYKGSERSAGFLSMKLMTYNFEPHLMQES